MKTLAILFLVPILALADGIGNTPNRPIVSPRRPIPDHVDTRADAIAMMKDADQDFSDVQTTHQRIMDLAVKLGKLDQQAAKTANDQAANIASLASSGGSSTDQLLQATKQMQEMQMSFNLQYLQLQSEMQNENRSYTAVSNIMKTKHDTVKNSISNVR